MGCVWLYIGYIYNSTQRRGDFSPESGSLICCLTFPLFFLSYCFNVLSSLLLFIILFSIILLHLLHNLFPLCRFQYQYRNVVQKDAKGIKTNPQVYICSADVACTVTDTSCCYQNHLNRCLHNFSSEYEGTILIRKQCVRFVILLPNTRGTKYLSLMLQ